MIRPLCAILCTCVLCGCVTASYDSTKKKTTSADGAVVEESHRHANYQDTRGSAEAFGWVLDQVDWKAIVSSLWPLAAGGGGIGTVLALWLKNLHAHKHQSIGRSQIRSARFEQPLITDRPHKAPSGAPRPTFDPDRAAP